MFKKSSTRIWSSSCFKVGRKWLNLLWYIVKREMESIKNFNLNRKEDLRRRSGIIFTQSKQSFNNLSKW